MVIVGTQPLGLWGWRGLQSQLWERLSLSFPRGALRGAQSLSLEGRLSTFCSALKEIATERKSQSPDPHRWGWCREKGAWAGVEAS